MDNKRIKPTGYGDQIVGVYNRCKYRAKMDFKRNRLHVLDLKAHGNYEVLNRVIATIEGFLVKDFQCENMPVTILYGCDGRAKLVKSSMEMVTLSSDHEWLDQDFLDEMNLLYGQGSVEVQTGYSALSN